MKQALITKTDGSCFILGKHYEGLPIIHDENGKIYDEQTNYLRYLAVHRGQAAGTVYEVAKGLKEHLNVMFAQGKEWRETSHDILLQWRNWYIGDRRDQRYKRIINNKLSFIYQFLIWAEKNSFCSGVIGPFHVDDRKAYPVVIDIASADRSGFAMEYRFPLKYRTLRDIDSRNASAEEIDNLFVELANESDQNLAQRNILIGNWAEGPGLRLHEILALNITQLPSIERAQEALRQFSMMSMMLTVTKGGKQRVAILRPKLVIDTWNYINGARCIVARNKEVNSWDGSKVFISHRSGAALKPNTITKIFSEKQKILGITNASIHHLRSVAITNFVRLLFQQSKEMGNEHPDLAGILLRAKEFAGHSNESTTMKYIRLEQSRSLNFFNKEREIESNKLQFKKDEEREFRRAASKKLLN
jgi:integrase